METQNIYMGKTVEDAISAGLTALGIAREDAEIEVIEEGRKKLFGSIPAQVKVTEKIKLTDGQRAVEFLDGLFEMLKSDVVVELAEEDEKIIIQLNAATTKSLIGRRGEFIDAVQVLAGAVANTGRSDYKRVVVDCGNYREEREETLKHVAEKFAAKAVRLGKRVRLEPMNPYERRIIHAALVDNPDVTTKSEGKEPARFVVITPKNLRTFDKNRTGRGGYNNRGNGGNRGYNNRNSNSQNNGNRGNYRDKNYANKERKPYPKRELPAEGTPESSGTSFKQSSSSYRKGGFSGFFGTYLGNSSHIDETQTSQTETTNKSEDGKEE